MSLLAWCFVVLFVPTLYDVNGSNVFPPLVPGYTVLYTAEKNADKSSKHSWKQEIVTGQQLAGKQNLSVVVKQLKLNTTYYFKVQAKNSRTYGASSPTVLFRTPSGKSSVDQWSYIGQLGSSSCCADHNSQR